MPSRTRPSHHAYAGATVLLGILSVAVGGGYWWWAWSKRKEDDEKEANGKTPAQLGSGTTTETSSSGHGLAASLLHIFSHPPDAQTTPVAPPTVATIKQAQHWLNVLNHKRAGEPGALAEDGSAGPQTMKAIQAFQLGHGMAATGKLDGMTQSLLAQSAQGLAPSSSGTTAAGRIQAHVFWQPTPHAATGGHWAVADSLNFVTDIAGYSDPNHPPAESTVIKALVKHYGPVSTVGKSLAAKNYDYSLVPAPHASVATSGDFPALIDPMDPWWFDQQSWEPYDSGLTG
jgi:peptidoglycan hydrolase-like protein with peptidoglycan-binding domain